MSKERDIQILQHKIAELTEKIEKFIDYGISEKKKEALEIRKMKYEDELEAIMFN